MTTKNNRFKKLRNNQIIRNAILLCYCIVLISVLVNCTLQKRHFRRGYYVEWEERKAEIHHNKKLTKTSQSFNYNIKERNLNNHESLSKLTKFVADSIKANKCVNETVNSAKIESELSKVKAKQSKLFSRKKISVTFAEYDTIIKNESQPKVIRNNKFENNYTFENRKLKNVISNFTNGFTLSLLAQKLIPQESSDEISTDSKVRVIFVWGSIIAIILALVLIGIIIIAVKVFLVSSALLIGMIYALAIVLPVIYALFGIAMFFVWLSVKNK